jgi:hypothetical protein
MQPPVSSFNSWPRGLAVYRRHGVVGGNKDHALTSNSPMSLCVTIHILNVPDGCGTYIVTLGIGDKRRHGGKEGSYVPDVPRSTYTLHMRSM